MSTLDRELAGEARPEAIGYQTWHDLLFLHWRVPSEMVAGLLPRGIVLDTWDGDAWIGLVAFHMTGIRPWWLPALPYVSAFAETNVRTYVRCGAREPGIWFFSLDAARLAAVLVARWKWRLNYHWARMRVSRGPLRASYSSRRFGRGAAFAEIEAEIGPLPGAGTAHSAAATVEGSIACPGTLEHFLVERYVFYNQLRAGAWQQGRVCHAPYRLWPARLLSCEQSLLPAAGLAVAGPPCHAIFSRRVDAAVEPLRLLGTLD
jgi:uncharacterized protein